MADSGDKYKIQIVRTGIGDPFLVVNFEFQDDGLSPIEHPISQFEVVAFVSNDENNWEYIGYTKSESIAKMGPYRIGIPFDEPPGFSESETVYVQLQFGSDGHGGDFEVVATPNTTGETISDSHPYKVTITFNTKLGVTEAFQDQVYYSWPN